MTFSIAVGLAAAGLMMLRVFVPSSIGLADNGDAMRTTCRLGVTPHYQPNDERKVAHAFFRYDRLNTDTDPWILEVCQNYIEKPYLTSEYPFLKAAYWLHQALPLNHHFDIRTAGVLACLIIGLAFGLFAAALTGTWLIRIALCASLWIVVADAAFAAYLNTPYAEVPSLLGILIASICVVYLASKSKRSRLLALGLFTLAGIFAIFAKSQMVTLVLPLAAFALAFEVPVRRLRGRFAGRALPALAVILMAASVLWSNHNQRADYALINRTELIFASILGTHPDPKSAAAELGIPTQLERYAGTSWWDENPVHNDPAFEDAVPQLTFRNAGAFLARHPDRALDIADISAREFLKARPPNLGSYATGDQPAQTQESRIALVSTALQKIGNLATFNGYYLIVVFSLWLLFNAIGISAMRNNRSEDSTNFRGFGAAIVFLGGVFFMQFGTAAFGEGIETTKHMIIAIFALALMACFSLVLSAGRAPMSWLSRNGRHSGGYSK